jgi:ABC-2 type transport system permease protein
VLGGSRRLVQLIAIDISDTLRPPGFDAMIVLLAALGGALAVIQPLTEGYAIVFTVLEITIFATTIFLALRGAAGITALIESGVMSVYLSYPLPREGVALALLVSRVVVPSALLLGAPALIAVILLWRQAVSQPLEVVAMYSAYLTQAVFYGSVFALIALKAKSPGTSGVLGVAFYFAYNVAAILLAQVGASLGVEELTQVANSMILHIALYNMFSGAYNLEPWTLAVVPLAAGLASSLFIAYFASRFEP